MPRYAVNRFSCWRDLSIRESIIVVVRSANHTFCSRSEQRLSDSCFFGELYLFTAGCISGLRAGFSFFFRGIGGQVF